MSLVSPSAGRSGKNRASASASIPAPAPLFEALLCETQGAAILCAIVASCLNGSAENPSLLERKTIGEHMPPEPELLLALTRRAMLDVELLPETKEVVEDFFVALGELKRAFASFYSESSYLGLARAEVLHGRQLRQAARIVCHESLRAVRALEIETPGRLPDLYCQHAQALSRILSEAELGGTPCLDSDGRPFMPELPQRRIARRRTLSQNCWVTIGGMPFKAFAKDIAEGGMGLMRVPILLAGQRVTVELESGRVFSGAVAWCRGDSAGIRFLENLHRTDQLLAI